MTIQLPEDLQQFVDSCVQNGRFASEAEAVGEAVRLLKRREESAPEDCRTPRISQEEIHRRKQNKGKGYTTVEVLKHLETL
jgi:putative addiction module CopG family antidote